MFSAKMEASMTSFMISKVGFKLIFLQKLQNSLNPISQHARNHRRCARKHDRLVREDLQEKFFLVKKDCFMHKTLSNKKAQVQQVYEVQFIPPIKQGVIRQSEDNKE